jgi:predicted O-methyltransferase YrrM
MFKFPDVKPSVKPDMHGWFNNDNKIFLKNIINKQQKIIIELGSWLGSSTRWFCDNTNATIYAVDHWLGSNEHQGRVDVKDKLPILYETFIVNCWEYKDRIVPIRLNTIAGLQYLYDNQIVPDVIYVDASHEEADVIADIEKCLELFPDALITGDDWSWKNKKHNKRYTVRDAVLLVALKHKLHLTNNNRCWVLKRK